MLPETPFTIHGGCNCRAIRYRVSVPAFSERPNNPYKTPGADIGDLRIPMVAVCHCNDCRRATASVLPHALVTDISTVEVSIKQSESTTNSGSDSQSNSNTESDSNTNSNTKTDTEFHPASKIFHPSSPNFGKHLKNYRSSPGRNRWFCGTCGTNLAYSIDDGVVPANWNWPKMLDVWLGTVDREDIEKDHMRPERRLWCDMGVPWIRELASRGLGPGVPGHPLSKIDEVI